MINTDTRCCRKVINQAKIRIKKRRLELVRECIGFLTDTSKPLEARNNLLNKLARKLIEEGLYAPNGKYDAKREASYASARCGIQSQYRQILGNPKYDEWRTQLESVCWGRYGNRYYFYK